MVDEQQQSTAPTRINPALLIFLTIPLIGIVATVVTGFNSQQSGITASPSAAIFASGSLVNSQAPDFTLQAPNGESIQLSNLRGKWVFLNFWATWCLPCKREMATFQQFIDGKLGDRSKATILAVDIRESADQVKGFMAENQTPSVPVVLDLDGSVNNLYHVVQIPVTYIIDPTGIIRYEHIGEMTPTYLQGYLAKAQ